jgi:hypothetical protein
MEVKKEMTNATTGGTQMETSTPAVGKYKKTSDKVQADTRKKLFPARIMVLL